MPTIPSYGPPDATLTTSDLVLGWSGNRNVRVTFGQIADLTDATIKPLRADGSRAAAADLPMGSHRLTNVGDPVDPGDAVTARFLAATQTSTKLGFRQSFVGAQDDTVGRKLSEVRSLLDALPAAVRAAVIAGTNTTDLAPYINAALALGGAWDTLTYTYLIKSRIIPAVGTRLTGGGTFLADLAFSDAAYPDGLNIMIAVVSGLTLDTAVTFDGNSNTSAGFWIWGARNLGPVNSVTIRATFQNLSFIGIDISRNAGGWTNGNIVCSSHVENVGWTGINLEGCVNLNHDGCSTYRTGYHGILVTYSAIIFGDSFRANKATPPYRIYNGPGSLGGAEAGFLFGHFGNQNAQWTRFFLFDNRNAAYDGFGIGEGGSTEMVGTNIYAQGQIWYAGLFGFDVVSDTMADLQIFFPAQQGVQVGLDLGGTIANVDIRAQVFNCVNAGAVRFSATGSAPRTVALVNGQRTCTITAGSGFVVVPGQAVTGDPSIPTGTTVTAVNGNTVTLSTAATASKSANLTFRGIVQFVNVRLNVRAAASLNGVDVESGLDGYASYSGCEVSGDLSSVSNKSVNLINGTVPTGLAFRNVRYASTEKPVSGSTFAAVEHDTFSLTSTGTLSTITGGYERQEITVYINGTDTALQFDWPNANGNGASRLIGNGNSPVTVKVGGMFKARFRDGIGWYVHAISQPN